MTAIDATQAAWRAARNLLDRDDTARHVAAEQAAWEAYTEACAEVGQCIAPGCTTISEEHVYCPEHRE